MTVLSHDLLVVCESMTTQSYSQISSNSVAGPYVWKLVTTNEFNFQRHGREVNDWLLPCSMTTTAPQHTLPCLRAVDRSRAVWIRPVYRD